MRLVSVFAVAILLPNCILSESLYDKLGVSSSASEADIKRAYRKKAKQYHPDRNKDPESVKIFNDLTTAYECLSDSGKRRKYDSMGMEGCGDAPAHHPSPFDFFFGDDMQERGSREQRGSDIVVDLPATLEEIYNGEFVEIVRSRSVKKSKPGTRECNCRNVMETRHLGMNRMQMIQKRVCSECPNYEFVTEDRQLEVEIEIGVRDGHVYPFAGEGEPHPDGESGDLKFYIRQQPHAVFHRRGDDLFTNVTIGLVDALVGFEFEIKHLDGHKVQVKRSEITWPGSIMRINNEGMPRYDSDGKRGSLFITFDVTFPREKQLSSEEKETITKIFGSDKPRPSKQSAVYGIPSVKPSDLASGVIKPTLYNGFRSASVASKYLSNSLR